MLQIDLEMLTLGLENQLMHILAKYAGSAAAKRVRDSNLVDMTSLKAIRLTSCTAASSFCSGACRHDRNTLPYSGALSLSSDDDAYSVSAGATHL